MELTEIQQAIEMLPHDQRAALLSWLEERDLAEWDLQIERDFSPGGAGMRLLDQVKTRVRRGESRPMSEGEKHG